jgi:hypothetical protein
MGLLDGNIIRNNSQYIIYGNRLIIRLSDFVEIYTYNLIIMKAITPTFKFTSRFFENNGI